MLQKIKIAQILQQYTDDKEFVEVEGSSVRECLNDLIKKYPETKNYIFDVNNSPLVIVLNNGEIVLPRQMDDKLSANQSISLVPVVAGG
jgi:molybdopterin converting factor small subunit